MRRIAVALVIPLLIWPAVADDEKPTEKAKDKAKSTQSVPAVPLIQRGGGSAQAKPGTPAAEYQALMKEYSDAQQAFFKDYQAAKDEDKPKFLEEKHPTKKYAPKFLELAEKNPKDPVAVDALVWVVTYRFSPLDEKDSPHAKALAILARDYVTSDKIGAVCQSLRFQMNDPKTEALLRAILEKNPSLSVQAEACLALAQSTKSEELFQRFADKYVAEMKPERLANMFQMLSYSVDKSGEKLLRTLLEKDKRHDVQGVACLTLAQVLKRQADAQAGEQGDKLRNESETLLEKAIEKYADVQMQYYGTVGKKAKGELHALRYLAVGKPAPEVEGVDQDGQKFKLSDYKGKVVLLDFWSQF